MRMSQMFGKTLRQDPAEAETISHRLMLKAGLIHQVAAGVYSYLPFAYRVLRKIEDIIRYEMDRTGAQELKMPALQPLDLWGKTGRDVAFGEILFRLDDRRTRPMIIGPTHEEVITLLVHHNVQSYRDLPVILYQIQTKFRDEARPRAGLIRGREFEMKDAYSFDVDEEGLDIAYDKMLQAYRRIFALCDLPYIVVEADSGAIGGKDSHEFILPAESGEDLILTCEQCGYSANSERARFNKPVLEIEAENPLELVETPEIKTIQALTKYLDISASKTLKAVFYVADHQTVLVTIRGDFEVNETKLKNLLHATDLRLATPEESEKAGLIPGYTSPISKEGIRLIADDSINLANNFVVGGNKEGYHFINANHPRDFAIEFIRDIALAAEGHGCPECGHPLQGVRGIEVGHLFKLGTAYSNALDAFYLDNQGLQKACVMGCYGLGVSRVLASAIEQNHDSRGIIWPLSIAPYQVQLLGIGLDKPDVIKEAENLYDQLTSAGLDVLYDDRPESPGVKFNDADLLGIPVRLVVSPRTLENNSVEIKNRVESEAAYISLDGALAAILDRLKSLEL